MPILSRTPASIADAAVGASTCASGNHVCSGQIGTLTAKPRKKSRNSHHCNPDGSRPPSAESRIMSNVLVLRYSVAMPTSMNTEPNSV